MTQEWTTLGRKLSRSLGSLAPELYERLRDRMEDFGLEFVDRMKARVRSPAGRYSGSPLAAGQPPGVRSGRLRRSFFSEVDGVAPDIGSLKVTVGSTEGVIAGAQEFGATIRPKRARYLTIPLPAALTASGVPRADLRTAGDAIRSGAFFYRSRNGNLLLARRAPRGGSLENLFVLKDQVTLSPRLGMRDTFKKMLPGFRQDSRDAIRDAFRAAVRQGRGTL